MPEKNLELNHLSTTKVSQFDLSNYLIVWPVSSTEQHGPHLPLGTDAMILGAVVDGVLADLDEGFKGLFLPTLKIGKSPEHLSFPGTVSFRSSTMLAMFDDVVSSLQRHGSKTFVFLNSHGGNSSLIDAAGYDLRDKYGVKTYHLFLWTGKEYEELLKRLFPALQDLEIHAASHETSLMLYLHPELVGEIPPANPASPVIGSIPYGWRSLDFGQSGVIGDPSFASAQAGEALYHFAVKNVCDKLHSIRC